MKFEVSDSIWFGVLKKLDLVFLVLFKDGVFMILIKFGFVNRILILRMIYVYVVILCILIFFKKNRLFFIDVVYRLFLNNFDLFFWFIKYYIIVMCVKIL